MSIERHLRKIILRAEILPRRAIRYISGAVAIIFSPTKDDYPATGVQPFEGNSANEKPL